MDRQHWTRGGDGRDGALEDQLLLTIVLQQYRVLIKGANLAYQLYSADQIDGNWASIFAERIKKRVLKILLRRLEVHVPPLIVIYVGLDYCNTTESPMCPAVALRCLVEFVKLVLKTVA